MRECSAIELATSVTGTSIISLDSCTDVKLTGGQKNPHQGTVTKVTSKVRGILIENTSGYHDLVTKRLLQEGIDPGSYEPKERRWGEHIDDTPLITHKGNLYLQVITLGCGEVQYFCHGEPVAYQDGVMIDKDGYIISGIPSTPKPADQSGLKNKVIVRCYNIDSILQVRAFNKIWS